VNTGKGPWAACRTPSVLYMPVSLPPLIVKSELPNDHLPQREFDDCPEMPESTYRTARMMPTHPTRLLPLSLVALALALLAVIGYDYFHSLDLMEAKLVNILDDQEKPSRHILVVATLSNYPAYFFIPNRVRHFFYVQPELCFVTPDGVPLKDDYVGSYCFNQEDADAKTKKLHEMEMSEFQISFYDKPNDFDMTQVLYKTIVKQRGVLVRLTLAGYMVPPPVDSKPVFVSFAPYCKTKPEQCRRLFGWQ
jgi:hypothetical protein